MKFKDDLFYKVYERVEKVECGSGAYYNICVYKFDIGIHIILEKLNELAFERPGWCDQLEISIHSDDGIYKFNDDLHDEFDDEFDDDAAIQALDFLKNKDVDQISYFSVNMRDRSYKTYDICTLSLGVNNDRKKYSVKRSS